MANAAIDSHFKRKQRWMASHVQDAKFPTKESLEGHSLYQKTERLPVEHNNSQENTDLNLTFHRVDCHPLMIRYAVTLSKAWPETQRPLILEYLSQVSLTDQEVENNTKIALYLATQDGMPVGVGMLFESLEDQDWVSGIYDITAENSDISNAMLHFLIRRAEAKSVVCSPM
ncbi:hypothetical protein [Veronia pacifica]|uniref:N-acetyltransferase domain-containing protein n=1 Tax=Veronia pacifica TaxID=1080227 RepID=A0A1C3EKM5_9GAMM|nr:hypothetical protein [Veronia pacifica]ODA33781.1 hypothetical protein A8L45_09125 [Veronia pacifica]